MNRITLFFWLIIVALLISCDDEPIGLEADIIDEEPEFATGAICFGNGEYRINNNNLLIDFEMPQDMPDSLDLSPLLPPIRSQGQQGSCVSWAISYYMKSLQEKIQYGTDFTTEKITSPAYSLYL